MSWCELLGHLGACKEAVEWSAPYATLEEAWGACPRWGETAATRVRDVWDDQLAAARVCEPDIWWGSR